jgi:CspA family cold shock protein
MKGTVTWYDTRKGYGFIQGDDRKKIFVHKSALPFWTIFLSTGDKVEYQLENSKRGVYATNLKTL